MRQEMQETLYQTSNAGLSSTDNVCNTLKDFKNAKMKIIIFCIHYIFNLLKKIKTDGNDTLLLHIPNTGVFKAIRHHQLRITDLLCFALGFPTN